MLSRGGSRTMTRPRRILITNNTLANRAGSELYVRDLSKALRQRNHEPVGYSTMLGEVAEEMRLFTVPVIDDLSTLKPPDLIHGQHHLETMTALAHFPSTPAIFVCHGWLPWEETPPIHPRILRYVAVDTTVRDRLVIEHGIAEDRIDVVNNFVDLERFRPRPPLPPRPSRALVFSNEISHGPILESIMTACSEREITLDVRGATIGEPLSAPEEFLSGYDLIFARGRSAIESLAVGTAVIPTAPDTFGEIVTTANLAIYRGRNFGIRTIQYPGTPEGILQEIDRYDAEDAMAVSEQIRNTAGLDRAVEKMEAIYERVIAEFGASGIPPDDRKAFANYLHFLARSTKGQVLGLNLVPALRNRSAVLENTIEQLRADLTRSSQTAKGAADRESELAAEIEKMRAAKTDAPATPARVSVERSRLSAEVHCLTRALMDAQSEIGRLTASRGRLEASVDTLERSVSDLAQALAAAADDKKEWERSLTARGVGLLRRVLWK